MRKSAGRWKTFFFVVFVAVGLVGIADGAFGVLRADLDETLAVLRICVVARLFQGVVRMVGDPPGIRGA